MDLSEIKGNTLAERNSKNDIVAAEKVELKGSVEIKKKGLGERLISALLPQDVEATKEAILTKIILPSIKDLVFNAFQEWWYDGKKKKNDDRSPLDRPSYSNYVDYSKRENSRDRNEVDRRYSERDFDYRNIYFKYEEDATEVLHRMAEMLDRYPQVTVGNLYEILGKRTTSSLFDFGWRSLRDAEVTRERDGGATLRLPRAIPLD